MALPSAPAIEVNDLSVALGGRTIVDRLTFSVPIGQTTALIGPNGAGKSVLVKSLLRLVPKKSGEVKFFGIAHEHYKKIAADISYIPQRLFVDQAFPLTVQGLFSLRSKGPFGLVPADRLRMVKLLALVGMPGVEPQKLSTLSGGQLQRILIAYSLLTNPRLLILDEPSAGIDVQGQETVYALLERIKQEEKLTLLLVSHELDIVMRHADQVLCLNQKLICAGVPHEVLSRQILEEIYGDQVGHFHHQHAKA